MKRISIKLRITLLFTFFMLLLVSVMLGALFVTSRQLEQINYKNRLMEAVEESSYLLKGNAHEENKLNSSIEDINREDAKDMETRTDFSSFEGYQDGVYISVYNEDGLQLGGEVPDGFDSGVPFVDKQIKRMKKGGTTWFLYDQRYGKKEENGMWIRGIIKDSSSDSMQAIFLHLMFAAVPLFVIFVSILGYAMINHALSPIKKITVMAEQIAEGQDLSKRLRLGEGKDEIYTLAATFDHMFDRLEAFFENEKQFTSDASHELRTPTAVIISQCEYALENADSIEEAKDSIERILNQAKKMSSLIASLLLLARADKGQQKLIYEEISFDELTEMVIEQMQEIASDKNITITASIEKEICLSGDETMLMRMMINLMDNAIYYGRENGTIEVKVEQEGGDVMFLVKDDGIGIAKEHISKIFDRFYQVEPSRTVSNHSAGLGLSMVKWIVSAHGGEISVASELGAGTEFLVRIPLNRTSFK